MKITCDECRKEFNYENLNTGIEQLQNNIERHYIECPDCEAQYTAYYLNDAMKMIQAEIKKVRKKRPVETKHKNRILMLMKTFEKMNNQLKAEMKASG